MKYEKIDLEDSFKIIEIKISDEHPHAYKAHLHSELSVGIIEKGDTKLEILGTDYYFGEGDAVIIFPKVMHNCQPVEIENWSFKMLYLNETFYLDLLDMVSESLKVGIVSLDGGGYRIIENTLDVLESDVSVFEKEVAINDMLGSLFDSLSLEVSYESSINISEVGAYIEAHYLEIIKLEALAEIFNMNKFHLIRKFKKNYNTTPTAYQMQLKVDYAKKLLRTGNTVIDTAIMAGFYDQAHFSREFKKAMGMTPHAFCKSL